MKPWDKKPKMPGQWNPEQTDDDSSPSSGEPTRTSSRFTKIRTTLSDSSSGRIKRAETTKSEKRTSERFQSESVGLAPLHRAKRQSQGDRLPALRPQRDVAFSNIGKKFKNIVDATSKKSRQADVASVWGERSKYDGGKDEE